MPKLLKALMICAGLAQVAAPASACWSDAAYQAAQVREFETMLMVSALRCRTSGANFLEDYNQFVRTSRTTLSNVNDQLRVQFATDVGNARSLDAYDGYVTALANKYGAGSAGLSCDDFAWITHAAVATDGSASALVALAQNSDANPAVPGDRCGPPASTVVMAAR